MVKQVIEPFLPPSLKREPSQVILSRVLALLAHSGLVTGLVLIGCKHFERPITGLSMAACYLVLPYTRMAVVDSGQLISAALIILAVFWHPRPSLSGALIGLAAGWIPACLGLIALWAGFYRGRGMYRFLIVACSVAAVYALLGVSIPWLGRWASAERPQHRRGRALALVRAQVDRQLLGGHRLGVPASGPDRVRGLDRRDHDLAGAEKRLRADRPVGGSLGGQSVLVPR